MPISEHKWVGDDTDDGEAPALPNYIVCLRNEKFRAPIKMAETALKIRQTKQLLWCGDMRRTTADELQLET